MNVVDSSAWLEYFADGPNAADFAPAIQNTEELLVPSIVLLEVFKCIARQRGEEPALQAIAHMQAARVVSLDDQLSLEAARIGLSHKLPLADSIILATARSHEAVVWTQGSDFEALPDVEYRRHRG
jgi:predicted nucleic acid-binding protein